MKTLCAAAVLACAIAAVPTAKAQNSDPAPRQDLSPLERAKIKRAEAGLRRGNAVQQRSSDTQTTGRRGEQSCTTSVGTTQINSTPGQRTRAPRGDTVVVVRGDIINLCR